MVIVHSYVSLPEGINRGLSGKIHLEILGLNGNTGTASTFQHPIFDYWMVDPAFQAWKPSGNRNPRNPTILLVRLGIHIGTPRALCNHWVWVNLSNMGMAGHQE